MSTFRSVGDLEQYLAQEGEKRALPFSTPEDLQEHLADEVLKVLQSEVSECMRALTSQDDWNSALFRFLWRAEACLIIVRRGENDFDVVEWDGGVREDIGFGLTLFNAALAAVSRGRLKLERLRASASDEPV